MIPNKVVTPDEALNLMQEGFVYVDVRNQDEFEQGHPAHAYNVPLILRTDFGPAPNETFVETVKQHFGLDAKLVIGCASGGRSAKAVKMLADAGFTNLVDQKAGYSGGRDPTGSKIAGWRDSGLPIEVGQPEGRSYDDLAPEP